MAKRRQKRGTAEEMADAMPPAEMPMDEAMPETMSEMPTEAPAEAAPLESIFADALTGPGAAAPPRRRRRRLLDDPEDIEALVTAIIEETQHDKQERSDWMDKRLARYVKLRGHTSRVNPPWEHASDQHIPVMQANDLRVIAGLFNAVLGLRPVVFGKPTRIDHKEVAERNDSLLDHQFFVDLDGERRLEQYVTQFVEDGTAFAFQYWARERGVLYDVRVLPRPLEDGIAARQELVEIAAQENNVVFDELLPLDGDGLDWRGVYKDPEGEEQTVKIAFYDKDDSDKIELVFDWNVLTFDGPACQVMQLEDVVAPMRCDNLQPVSVANPTGARRVVKIAKVDLDTVRKRVLDGTYDFLSESDVDDMAAVAISASDGDPGDNESAIKDVKDEYDGREQTPHDADRQYVTVYEAYRGYDCHDTGINDECVFTVLLEPRLLARARYLSEIVPGIALIRPFAEARFVPIPGQLYGVGLPELMEGLSDMLHDLINDNLDAGKLAGMPWFGYRASSGFKPDVLRLGPGDGIPLDNPQQDLAFYQMPGGDQTWSFNMIGLGMQFLERLTQIGPLQFGQLPQGKASALRTVGTTMAVLQQSAAMPEQILRRLFFGIRDIFSQFHQLNTRFLPSKKRFLVSGKPLSQDTAYGVIDDRKDIAIPLTFDFQATLMNTNKGVVAQALMALGGAIFQPLSFQLGMVGPEQLYNWASDLIKASEFDPHRFIMRPAMMPDGPRITVEEAIVDLTNGVPPRSTDFIYPAQVALQKLAQFQMTPEFGFLRDGTLLLYQQYVEQVLAKAQAEAEAQMMAQLAGDFAKNLGGSGDPGGRPPQPGSPPDVQTQAPSSDEVAGANSRADA